MLAVAALVSTFASTSSAQTLVGRWITGSESLTDTSGFRAPGTHDGVAVGSNAAALAYSIDVPAGFSGKSLDLTANNVGVLIGNSKVGNTGYTNTFDTLLANQFSVAFWAKGFPGVWGPFVSKNGESSGFQVRRYSTGTKSTFSLRGTPGADDPGGSVNINDGLWHHFAAVWDGTLGTRKLYVDGTLDSSINLTGDTGPWADPSGSALGLGVRDNAGLGSYFAGKLYDVRVYQGPLTVSQVSVLYTGGAVAADLRWDTGDGNWDAATANWKLLSGGVNRNYAEFDSVTFDDTNTGISPLTVTLTARRTPASVTVNATKDYILTGQPIAGPTPLIKSGSGTLTLSGANTYGGGTTVNGGLLKFIDNKTGSSNFITAANLEFNLTSGTTQFNGGTFSGTGNLIKSGAGLMMVGGPGSPQIFALTGTASVIDVRGGVLRNEYGNSAYGGNKARLNVETGGIFDVWDGNTTVDQLTGTGIINKGWSSNTSLTIGANNGSSTFSGTIYNNNLFLGYGGNGGGNLTLRKTGTGTQTLAGVTITSGIDVTGGTLLLQSGTINCSGPGNFKVNVGNGRNFIQTGGSFEMNGYAVVNGGSSMNLTGGTSGLGLEMLLGFGGGGGTIHISGSHVADWYITRFDTGDATVNVTNGGTLRTDKVNREVASTSAVLRLDNGTLAVSPRNPNLSPNDWIQSGMTVLIANGGATFDTTHGSVTIQRPLQQDGTSGGGLTKTGINTLALTGINTYTGATTVTAGTLAVSGFAIADANTLIIDGGKVEPTGTETVGTLYFGSTQQASGTWGSTSSTATHLNDTYFSGTGVVNVASGPAGYAAWISGFVVGDSTPNGDPDGDGIENLLEYVLNGNPGTSSTAILPTQNSAGADYVFSFTRRAESPGDTTQVFQYGSNLSAWTDVAITAGSQVVIGVASGGLQQVTVTVPKSGLALFGRLKATQP